MDSKEDTDTGNNSQSTSYAAIAFGRSSPSQAPSDLRDSENSLTLENEPISPRENRNAEHDKLQFVSRSKEEVGTKPGTVHHLKAAGQRRSRDQRSGPSKDRNRKPLIMRHTSSSPCAPRKQTGSATLSGLSPPQRSVSTVPPAESMGLAPEVSEAAWHRSRSPLWNPDGKSPSYAEIFFGHPSTPIASTSRTESIESVPAAVVHTLAQNPHGIEAESLEVSTDPIGSLNSNRSSEPDVPNLDENIEIVNPEWCAETDNTMALAASIESDVFAAMSQFQCVEEVESKGKQDMPQPLDSTPTSVPKPITSYSNILASGLKNVESTAQPVRVRKKSVEAYIDKPSEIQRNVPIQGSSIKSTIVQHPTIPGLVLRKDEASLFEPKSGSAHRRRKHGKPSSVLPLEIDGESSQDEGPGPLSAASAQLLNLNVMAEEERDSKPVREQTKTQKKNVLKPKKSKKAVPLDKKDEEEKAGEVAEDKKIVEEVGTPSCEPTIERKSDSTSSAPDNEASLEAAPVPLKNVVAKKKKSKPRAKPSYEDEIEKALKEIEMEERSRSKRDSNQTFSLESLDVKPKVEAVAPRKTVKAKRKVIKTEEPLLKAEQEIRPPTKPETPTTKPLSCVPTTESAKGPALIQAKHLKLIEPSLKPDIEYVSGEEMATKLTSSDVFKPTIPEIEALKVEEFVSIPADIPCSTSTTSHEEKVPKIEAKSAEQSYEMHQNESRHIGLIVSEYETLMLTHLYDSAEQSFNEYISRINQQTSAEINSKSSDKILDPHAHEIKSLQVQSSKTSPIETQVKDAIVNPPVEPDLLSPAAPVETSCLVEQPVKTIAETEANNTAQSLLMTIPTQDSSKDQTESREIGNGLKPFVEGTVDAQKKEDLPITVVAQISPTSPENSSSLFTQLKSSSNTDDNILSSVSLQEDSDSAIDQASTGVSLELPSSLETEELPGVPIPLESELEIKLPETSQLPIAEDKFKNKQITQIEAKTTTVEAMPEPINVPLPSIPDELINPALLEPKDLSIESTLESFVLPLSRKEKKKLEKEKKREKSSKGLRGLSKSPIPHSSPSPVDNRPEDVARKRVSQKDMRKKKNAAGQPHSPDHSVAAVTLESEIVSLPPEATSPIRSETSISVLDISAVKPESEASSFHLKVDEFSDAWMDMLDDGFTISDEELDLNDEAIQNKQAPALSEEQGKNELIPPTSENIGAALPLETTATTALLPTQGQPEFHLKGDRFSDEWMNILDDSSFLISFDEEDANDVRQESQKVEAEDQPKLTLSSPDMNAILASEIDATLSSDAGDIRADSTPDSNIVLPISEITHELLVTSEVTGKTEEPALKTNLSRVEESLILADCESPQLKEQVSDINSMELMMNEYAQAESQWHMHLAQKPTTDANVNTACLDNDMHPSSRTEINVGTKEKPEPFPNSPEHVSLKISPNKTVDEAQPSSMVQPDVIHEEKQVRKTKKSKPRPKSKLSTTRDRAAADPVDAAISEIKLSLTHSKTTSRLSSKPLVEAASKVVQEIQKLDANLEIPSCIVKDTIKNFEAIAAKKRLKSSVEPITPEPQVVAYYPEDAKEKLVVLINEFLNSCQDQILAYNDAERIWQEHLAGDKRRETESKVGSGHDDPKPPPDSDPFNRKGDPGGKDDGKGGGSGGSGGSGGDRPLTHILYSGLSQLGSEWLDSSTKVPAHIYDYDCHGSVEESRTFGGVGTRTNFRRPIRLHSKYAIVPDYLGIIGEPRITFQDHYLRTIKDSTQIDLQSLEELLKSSALKISTLNIEALEETAEQTDELLSTFKDLELSFSTLKEIISGLPQQDAEVKDLGHQSSDLVYQTRALLSYTGKLNKCAKDRIVLKQREQTDILEDNVVLVPASENEESNSVVAVCTTQESNLPLVMADGGDDDVMTSLDAATITLPKTEIHALMHDGSGGTFVAKVERSGFITKTREISVVQSFQDGVPGDADSNITFSASHYQDQSQSQYSEGDQQEPSHSSHQSKFLRTIEGDSNSAVITEMRSNSPIPSGSMSPSLLEHLVPQGDDDSLTVRVRQVTQHVTRRIIRKRRRIIRKVTVINGVETVTEEVIEEPDEVDEHTSEFSSGPVTDFTGSLGNVGTRHGRRPRSPGVIISEVHDQFLGTGSPLSARSRSPSPQMKHGRAQEEVTTMKTKLPPGETKSTDVQQPFGNDELPISISECSMKISVKPVQESSTQEERTSEALKETLSPAQTAQSSDEQRSLDGFVPEVEEHSHKIGEEIIPTISEARIPVVHHRLKPEDDVSVQADISADSQIEAVKIVKKSKKKRSDKSPTRGQVNTLPEVVVASANTEVTDTSSRKSEISEDGNVPGSFVGTVSHTLEEVEPVSSESCDIGTTDSVATSRNAEPSTEPSQVGVEKEIHKEIEKSGFENSLEEIQIIPEAETEVKKLLLADNKIPILERASTSATTEESVAQMQVRPYVEETGQISSQDATSSPFETIIELNERTKLSYTPDDIQAIPCAISESMSQEIPSNTVLGTDDGQSTLDISTPGIEHTKIHISTDSIYTDGKILSAIPGDIPTSADKSIELPQPDKRKKRRNKKKVGNSFERSPESIEDMDVDSTAALEQKQPPQTSVAVEAFDAWAQTGSQFVRPTILDSTAVSTPETDESVAAAIASHDLDSKGISRSGDSKEAISSQDEKPKLEYVAVETPLKFTPESDSKAVDSAEPLHKSDIDIPAAFTADSLHIEPITVELKENIASDTLSNTASVPQPPLLSESPIETTEEDIRSIRRSSGPKPPPRHSKSPSPMKSEITDTEENYGLRQEQLPKAPQRRRQSKSPSPMKPVTTETEARYGMEQLPKAPPRRTQSKSPSPGKLDTFESKHDKTVLEGLPKAPPRRRQSKSPSPLTDIKSEKAGSELTTGSEDTEAKQVKPLKLERRKRRKNRNASQNFENVSTESIDAEDIPIVEEASPGEISKVDSEGISSLDEHQPVELEIGLTKTDPEGTSFLRSKSPPSLTELPAQVATTVVQTSDVNMPIKTMDYGSTSDANLPAQHTHTDESSSKDHPPDTGWVTQIDTGTHALETTAIDPDATAEIQGDEAIPSSRPADATARVEPKSTSKHEPETLETSDPNSSETSKSGSVELGLKLSLSNSETQPSLLLAPSNDKTSPQDIKTEHLSDPSKQETPQNATTDVTNVLQDVENTTFSDSGRASELQSEPIQIETDTANTSEPESMVSRKHTRKVSPPESKPTTQDDQDTSLKLDAGEALDLQPSSVSEAQFSSQETNVKIPSDLPISSPECDNENEYVEIQGVDMPQISPKPLRKTPESLQFVSDADLDDAQVSNNRAEPELDLPESQIRPETPFPLKPSHVLDESHPITELEMSQEATTHDAAGADAKLHKNMPEPSKPDINLDTGSEIKEEKADSVRIASDTDLDDSQLSNKSTEPKIGQLDQDSQIRSESQLPFKPSQILHKPDPITELETNVETTTVDTPDTKAKLHERVSDPSKASQLRDTGSEVKDEKIESVQLASCTDLDVSQLSYFPEPGLRHPDQESQIRSESQFPSSPSQQSEKGHHITKVETNVEPTKSADTNTKLHKIVRDPLQADITPDTRSEEKEEWTEHVQFVSAADMDDSQLSNQSVEPEFDFPEVESQIPVSPLQMLDEAHPTTELEMSDETITFDSPDTEVKMDKTVAASSKADKTPDTGSVIKAEKSEYTTLGDSNMSSESEYPYQELGVKSLPQTRSEHGSLREISKSESKVQEPASELPVALNKDSAMLPGYIVETETSVDSAEIKPPAAPIETSNQSPTAVSESESIYQEPEVQDLAGLPVSLSECDVNKVDLQQVGTIDDPHDSSKILDRLPEDLHPVSPVDVKQSQIPTQTTDAEFKFLELELKPQPVPSEVSGKPDRSTDMEEIVQSSALDVPDNEVKLDSPALGPNNKNPVTGSERKDGKSDVKPALVEAINLSHPEIEAGFENEVILEINAPLSKIEQELSSETSKAPETTSEVQTDAGKISHFPISMTEETIASVEIPDKNLRPEDDDKSKQPSTTVLEPKSIFEDGKILATSSLPTKLSQPDKTDELLSASSTIPEGIPEISQKVSTTDAQDLPLLSKSTESEFTALELEDKSLPTYSQAIDESNRIKALELNAGRSAIHVTDNAEKFKKSGAGPKEVDITHDTGPGKAKDTASIKSVSSEPSSLSGPREAKDIASFESVHAETSSLPAPGEAQHTTSLKSAPAERSSWSGPGEAKDTVSLEYAPAEASLSAPGEAKETSGFEPAPAEPSILSALDKAKGKTSFKSDPAGSSSLSAPGEAKYTVSFEAYLEEPWNLSGTGEAKDTASFESVPSEVSLSTPGEAKDTATFESALAETSSLSGIGKLNDTPSFESASDPASFESEAAEASLSSLGKANDTASFESVQAEPSGAGKAKYSDGFESAPAEVGLSAPGEANETASLESTLIEASPSTPSEAKDTTSFESALAEPSNRLGPGKAKDPASFESVAAKASRSTPGKANVTASFESVLAETSGDGKAKYYDGFESAPAKVGLSAPVEANETASLEYALIEVSPSTPSEAKDTTSFESVIAEPSSLTAFAKTKDPASLESASAEATLWEPGQPKDSFSFESAPSEVSLSAHGEAKDTATFESALAETSSLSGLGKLKDMASFEYAPSEVSLLGPGEAKDTPSFESTLAEASLPAPGEAKYSTRFESAPAEVSVLGPKDGASLESTKASPSAPIEVKDTTSFESVLAEPLSLSATSKAKHTTSLESNLAEPSSRLGPDKAKDPANFESTAAEASLSAPGKANDTASFESVLAETSGAGKAKYSDGFESAPTEVRLSAPGEANESASLESALIEASPTTPSEAEDTTSFESVLAEPSSLTAFGKTKDPVSLESVSAEASLWEPGQPKDTVSVEYALAEPSNLPEPAEAKHTASLQSAGTEAPILSSPILETDFDKEALKLDTLPNDDDNESKSQLQTSEAQATVSEITDKNIEEPLRFVDVLQKAPGLKQFALNVDSDPISDTELYTQRSEYKSLPDPSKSYGLPHDPLEPQQEPTEIFQSEPQEFSPDQDPGPLESATQAITIHPQDLVQLLDPEYSIRTSEEPHQVAAKVELNDAEFSVLSQLTKLPAFPSALSEEGVDIPEIDSEQQASKRRPKSKKSQRIVKFKDSAVPVHDLDISEDHKDDSLASQDITESRVDIVDVTDDPRYADPKVEDCKRKLNNLSKAKRETKERPVSTVAIPVLGSNVLQSLQTLAVDLPKLAEAIAREDTIVIFEEFTTILEIITVTMQNIQYEITKLDRSSIPDKDYKKREMESQISQLKSMLEELESLSQSTGLDGDLKTVLSDICKGSSLELDKLLDKVAENDSEEELRKKNFDGIISELSEANTKLRSLEEQITSSAEVIPLFADSQLTRLDSVEQQYQLMKPAAELIASKGYQLLLEDPNNEVLNKLEELNERIVTTDNLISEERNKILQVINLSEEYEETLKEFSQVIKVAESLLSVRPTVKNLKQMKDQIQTHRRFFGNLKRCQQALEKLELDLDGPTKEAHHELHQRLYLQASDILERASKKRQLLAVTASRFARLQDGIKEESQWLDSLANRIPSLDTVKSTSSEHFCSLFQGLYTDVIVHQARILQLKAVSDGLAESIDCPDLGSQVDATIENLLVNSNKITSSLQSLVGFRDIYSNYERLIIRLRNWLKKAESKMDHISLQPQAHPYDFWELKAQLENQQPLRDEAVTLLNQALTLLSVRDEGQIRENFENFDDSWNNLLKAVAETELENYVDEEATTSSIEDTLNSVDNEVQELQTTLQNISVVVESEEDLYSYLETLQILKAQILNQKYRLNTISPKTTSVDPEDAERIGGLLRALSQVDLQISEELEAAHVIREKFSTFGRISLKTRRFQDTIRARVGQWSSFFELSQDILKQAFENCQSIDDDLSQNQLSLENMSHVLQTFPSTSHLSLSTAKLESELHEMEAVSHALTLQVDDLRLRVKEQMKFWQDFSSVSNSVAQLVSQHQITLELLVNEPPETLPALLISQRYLQGVEDSVRDNKSIEDLQNISEKLKSEYPPELKVQIESTRQSLLDEWEELELQINALQTSYSNGQELWSKIVPLKREIEEWSNTVCPQVELGKPTRLIKERVKNLPFYEDKMNELQALTTELCVTLYPAQKDKTITSSFRLPINSELEGLSKKLEFLRSYLSSMQAESSPDVLEEAKQTLSSVSEGLRTDTGAEPTTDRLNTVHQQLLNLGNAEGRMRAVQLSTSTVPDTEFLELLESSQSLFQQTFLEYLKIWAIISEKEDLNELYHLWKNYLNQVESYLAESVPVTREQLLEDASLCTVHQSILTGQYQSLASAMEKKPLDFETLQTLHTQIESQLNERQLEIQERLSSWKKFRNCQEGISLWLRHMEREKRGLELNFLQLRRLESTKAKIQALVSRCPRGEELIQEFKQNKMTLMPFCPPALKSSLAQDLSSHVSRYNNLQAALKTWLDHVNRLTNMNQDFQSKGNEIAMLLTNIWEQLHELRAPATFSELKTHIHKLKELQQQCSTLSPGLEEMQSVLEEIKAAISPADARILSQKIWSLSQQHIDLVTAIAENLAEAEEKLDLIPAFDSRCKRWMVWADGMREKLERPHSHDLEDYYQWIGREAKAEISSKVTGYQWLTSTVKQLSEMTAGKERKEFVKVSKEIKSKWEGLNETVERRSAKVTHLLQMLHQLSLRFQDSMKKLKHLENYVSTPLSIQEFKIDSINEALRVHEIEQRRLNNESSEINHVLNLGEVASSDCDEFRMYQDAASTRASLETLHNAWNGLIARFQQKHKLINQLKDNWRTISDSCDYLETLLSQVDLDIETLENDNSDSAETGNTESQISKAESLLECLRCLTPKVEDLANDYSFVSKQVNASSSGAFGDRVKGVISNWRSLTKRCQKLMEQRRRTLHFSNFCSVYEPAQDFLRNINEKVQALSIEKSYTAEEKIRILKELRDECQSQRVLEDVMKETGRTSSEADANLKIPITEQIDAYNAMKNKLEKLCSKVMQASQKQLVQKGDPVTKVKVEKIPVEDIAVQVSTLAFERMPELEVDSRRRSTGEDDVSIPVSDASISEVQADAPSLTRVDIYKNELDKAIEDSEENLKLLEGILSKVGKGKNTHDHVVKALAATQKSVEMVVHLHDLLTKEHGASAEFSRGKKVKALVKKLKEKEERARTYGQSVRESSPAKKVTCPVCSPKQRGVWDSTLWRLEQWLQHAEGTLKETMRKRPPTNLEHLEDYILSHRELLLDLDSHRSLVHALTNVLSHLGEHGATETIGEMELERLKDRLSQTLQWWNKVCHNAASWQARLQIALLENSDFHQTIEEYDTFISSIKDSIKELEPVDVSVPHNLIVPKLRAFKQLSEKLVRIEPELRTLLQTAEQLFVNAKAIEKEGALAAEPQPKEPTASIFTTPECSLVLDRIATLNHELGTSLRVSEAYVKYLTNVVQHEELPPGESPAMMLNLSDQILDLGSASPARSSTPLPSTSADNDVPEEAERSLIAAGGRYAYRAFRASLPIQALLLLLLGAASLLPYSEQDFSCFSANNFARSLEPMLHWNGPPRI